MDSELRRDIGFFGSAFLAFNGLVGASIFALPGTLQSRFGDSSPFLFPFFGLLALAIAIPFGRVAARFPTSGGPVVYAGTFGPLAAFQAGWIWYVARVTAMAANCNVLVTYLATLWPPLAGGVSRAATILAICLLVTVVNVAGVRKAIRLLDAATLLKAAPLLFVAILGLVLSAGSIPLPTSVPPLSELEAAALLILYAFVGFEGSVVAAGETRDPARTIPRALVTTIVATGLLYFLVQLAYVSVMRPGEGGDAPMVAFGAALLGPAGALLMTAAAIFSLLGNISGGVTSASRATYALGRDGLLPAWFGRVAPRFATPANSVVFMGAMIALLAISGSFVWLAVVSTLARMLVYAISIAALPKVERLGMGRWALVAAGLGVCLWAALQSEWASWRVLLILAAAGTILYAAARASARKGRVSSIQPPPSTRSPS